MAANGLTNLSITTGIGDDTLVVQTGNLTLPVSGGAFSFDGGAGSDTIQGPDTAITWNLSGAGAGTLGGPSGLSFTGVEKLVGGAGQDTFVFPNGVSFGGTIDGGSDAANTLDYSGWSSGVTVDLSTSMTPGVTTLIGVENVIGTTHADTLTGDADANILNGGGGADVLTGGAGDDTYVMRSDGTLVTITELADEGSDTLDYSAWSAGITVELTADTTYRPGINAACDLSTLENIVGTAFADTLIGNGAASVLTGGGGNDTLNGGGGDDTYIFGDAWGLDTITDCDGTDTLDFSAVTEDLVFTIKSDQTVIVTGASGDSVTLGDNTKVEGLVGGTGTNTFAFEAGGSFPGGITGSEAETSISILDYSAYGSGVTVDLDGGTATGTTSVSLIDKIIGTSYADTLTGDAGDNILEGRGGNDTLTGGCGDDTYIFSNGWGSATITEEPFSGDDEGEDTLDFSAVTANLTFQVEVNADGDEILTVMAGGNTVTASNVEDLVAGSGVNTLDYSAYGSPVIVNLTTGEAAVFYSISGFRNVTGSAYDDTITGDDQVNVLIGGDGNDFISGGAGNDTIQGGAGTDTVVETRDANFTLTDTTLTIGAEEVDTLSSIEKAQLTGGDSANTPERLCVHAWGCSAGWRGGQ